MVYDARHKAQTISQGIHSAVSFTYANAAERLAAGPFQPYDKYKIAAQLDDNSLWLLSDDATARWTHVTSGDVVAIVRDLNMDGYNIVNAGLVNGVNVGDHSGRHELGGADQLNVGGLSGQLADIQKINVKRNGTTIASEPNINFIEGSNVSLSVTNDVGNQAVNVRISASGGGGSGAAVGSLNAVLGNGNFTDGYDIVISPGDNITGDGTPISIIDGLNLNNYNISNVGTVDGYDLSAKFQSISNSLANAGVTRPTIGQNGYVAVANNGDLAYLAGSTEGDLLSWNATLNKWLPYAVSNFHGDFRNGGEGIGAARSLGNTDNYSLSFVTNNTTRMTLDADNGVYFYNNIDSGTPLTVVGSISQAGYLFSLKDFYNNSIAYFDYNGYLNIGLPGAALSNSPISAVSDNLNDFIQINIQNKNAGAAASSDIVATADNGTNTDFYVDVGINGSNYSQTFFSVTGPNDSYVIGKGGHLAIGTGTEGKNIVFFTGDTIIENVRATISDSGLSMSGYAITDVSDPINDQDVVTKHYLDGYIVSGPISSINNEIALFNGITGKSIKNSIITIDDFGNINNVNTVDGYNLNTQFGNIGARTITAGAGLTGGGDLTTDRTINVIAADSTITVNSDSIQVGTITDSNIASAAGIKWNKLQEVGTTFYDPSGFTAADKLASTISRVDGTRTFTIAPVSGSYNVWVGGTKFTKTIADSVVWTDVEGYHFFYFDLNGNLYTTHSMTVAIDECCTFVAAMHWDFTNKKSIFFTDERHGFMGDSTRISWFNAFGTLWISGGAIDNFTIGNGNLDIHAQLSVSDFKILADDTIFLGIDGYAQEFYPTLQAPVFYRTGASGVWRRKTADSYPMIYSGSDNYISPNGRVAYNQWTGSTWQLSEATQGDFVVSIIVATCDPQQPIIIICGQHIYTSLSEARTGVVNELAVLSSLDYFSIKRITPLGGVIIQTATTYSNTPKARFVAVDSSGNNYVDFRGYSKGAAASGSAVGVVLTATNPVNVDKSASNVGSLFEAARADHKHDISTALAVSTGSINSEGSATTLSRSDHRHAVNDLSITGQAQGSLIYFNGSNWVSLPAGVDGYVLTTHNNSSAPTWNRNLSGDVIGPNSATNNGIALFDTITGKLIKNSVVTVDDSGNINNILTIDGYNLYTQFGNIGARQIIAGNGLVGGGDLTADRTINITAGDSSIQVNADSIQVGTISDINHGNRSGGLLHALATSNTAGFESAEDKSKLDSINLDGYAQLSHNIRHELGGTDQINIAGLSGLLADNQKVNVKKNGSSIGSQTAINFIEGSNIALSVSNNSGSGQVDVTVTSTGGGGGGAVGTLKQVLSNGNTTDGYNIVINSGSNLSGSGTPISVQDGLNLNNTNITNVNIIDGYNLYTQFGNIKARTITAGAGLTGGGDLTTDRIINIVAADGSIQVNTDSIQIGTISDSNHGNRSGGPLHSEATTSNAGFMSAYDKSKLSNINLDGYNVTWNNVSAALGGQAGDGYYIFKSDGHGSGIMTKNVPKITHVLKVGILGDDVDYNSIAEAVGVAISSGASEGNYWQIIVYPGIYVEPPFIMMPGVILTANNATAIEGVWIVAANPTVDLITMYGGEICGITMKGVSGVNACLVRCSTPGSFSALEMVTFDTCTNGAIISDGASVIFNILAVTISVPGQDIGNWVTVKGAGTLVDVSNCAAVVPAAILPFYSNNPIQSLFDVSDGATLHIASATISLAHIDNTADVFHVDGGSIVTLLSCNITDSANALHIGSVGSNSQISFSGILSNNVLNWFCESSTGVLFINATADNRAISAVTGANESGTVNYINTGTYTIIGKAVYMFPVTEKETPLNDFIYDTKSTGLCEGGEVTIGTGLTVNVTAGEGWVRRSTIYKDVEGVFWENANGVVLTASSTNYIYYDSLSKTVISSISLPSETGVLLGTVITNTTGIRYIHKTRRLAADIELTLQNYLLTVSPQYLKSGLAVTQGESSFKLTVGSGSYYLGLDTINYDGYTNANWSYYYGSNGINENININIIDGYYYDNAGVLTSMTIGYYRTDYLILTSDGRLNLIYGTSQYTTPAASLGGALPAIPTFLLPSNMPLAKICVQQGIGITSITDARPTRSASGSGGSGVTVHSALAGLESDDHTQYILASGSRSMTGDLNLGGHNLVSVISVDGVDVSAHAARHLPGGIDALTIGSPVAISIGASSDGIAASYPRSDHQHGIAAGSPVTIGTTNSNGVSINVSRSDHQHAHGPQTDGTLHAVATSSTAGFESAADKRKLDLINLDGYVSGPASATSNAVVRFNATTGKLVKNSTITIDDSGNLLGVGLIDGYDISTGLYGTPTNGNYLRGNGSSWVGRNFSNDVLGTVGALTRDPTGFQISGMSNLTVLSKVDGTRTFTIAPTGSSFDVWVKGVQFTFASGQSVTWTNVEGIHFFYFDATGTLKSAPPGTDLGGIISGDGASVAYVYWDTTNSKSISFSEERHGLQMDGYTHIYLHNTVGARYQSGGALSGFVIDGNGTLETQSQFAVENVTLWDEDIKIYTGNSTQPLSLPAQIPIFYLSGASALWRKKTADVYPVIYSGTAGYVGGSGRLPYNQYTGTVWQLTELGNNDFVLVHYFATGDILEPIIGIQGQVQYTSQASAKNGAATELASIQGAIRLLVKEAVALGSVIFKSATVYSNVPKATIVSTNTGDNYVDFRTTTAIGSGSTYITTFSDGLFKIYDDLDTTKQMVFQASGITSATTRTLTAPDRDITLGNVLGPAALSSTDAAVVRWDGTNGQLVKNSLVTIDDSGNINNVLTIDGYNLYSKFQSITNSLATIVTAHSGLTGLSNDDHTQYLLASGTRSMTGSLNMGTYNITNAGTIDGYNLYTQFGNIGARTITAGSGLTGGGDLTADRTINVVAADATIQVNAHSIQVGTITDTNHGSRAGGTLHAVATSSTAGFESAADKAKLDLITLDGYVTGAASSTDTAIARWNGVTGKLIKNSIVTIDDAGNINNATTIDGYNLYTKFQSISNSVSTIVTDHSGLTGLSNDDHTQYLLANGTRTMAGSLNMGAYNITNVGTIDGYNLYTQFGNIGARNITAGAGLVGGGDLTADRTIAVAAGDSSITVNTHSIQVGVISDTNHGSRAGGNLHSNATSATAGFMAATDKNKLDLIILDGYVSGPASTTDTAIALFNGTTGKLVKSSLVTIDSSGNINNATTIDGYNLYTQFGNIGARQIIAGNGLVGGGDLTTDRIIAVAAGDSSITVNAHSIQVGTISDTNHGNRGGGTLHSNATSATAGFMANTDKAKLDLIVLDGYAQLIHHTRHENGGADQISVTGLNGLLNDVQKVNIKKNGASIGSRQAINLIEGSNVTLTVTDNSGSGQVDVTVAASGTGGGGAVGTLKQVLGNGNTTDGYNIVINSGNLTGGGSPISVLDGLNLNNTAITNVTTIDGYNLYTKFQSITNSLGTIVTVHSGLTGLSNDDHTQYLLASGTRSMTGSLNMGTYNITNAGTIDGYNLYTQFGNIGARQIIAGNGLVGGGDLTTDRTIAVAAGDSSITVNAHSIQVGTISDTNHGNRGGGALHSAATTSVNGFMSSTDKTKLDSFSLASQVQGSILYFDGSVWNTLAPGTDGYHLMTHGAAANPTWGKDVDTVGDVVGPASATDTAIALFNGTTGKLIKNSLVTIDASGNISIGTNYAATGVIRLANAAYIIARNAANSADISLIGLNASNRAVLGGYFILPAASGTTGQVLGLSDNSGTGTWLTAATLTAVVPQTVGTENALGSATTAALADHVHAHGSQTNGTLHAVATTSVAGFHSAADKTKSDQIVNNSHKITVASSAPGSPTTGDVWIDISGT